MNRRGFFRRTIGAVVAAACAPLLQRAVPALDDTLMFHGVPMVPDATWPIGTVGGIDRATFSFWRNQHTTTSVDESALQDAFNRCGRV